MNDNRIVSNNNKHSNLDDVAATADATADDTTVISKELVSNKEVVSNRICTENVVSTKDAISNLIGVANDNVTADYDDIDNAKSPPEYENSIRDLDGINDKYYQAEGKYCLIYDRSDDDNPPSLSPEPTLYAMNIPCIHSSIPNDGEILSLPLVSSVYQLEQSDDIDNAKSPFIGDLDEVDNLLDKMNEEYLFWRPHRDRDKEDSVDSAPVICTDIVSTETGSSNLIDVVPADAAADFYAIDLAITKPGAGVVPNEDANSVLIADDDNDNNPPPLLPELNLPCIHSIIKEVNKGFQFWPAIEEYGTDDPQRSHQDKEHPVDSVHASTEEAAQTTTPAPVIRTDILSTEDVSSNLNVVAVAITAAADDNDDNNIDNAKSSHESENSIGDLDGIKEEYLTEYETSSHGNNYYDNEDSAFCDRSDVDNPPPLQPESLDTDVWIFGRYRSIENNNIFDYNYNNIDKEILQFKYEDPIGESETIVFHDCDNNLNAIQ